MELRFGFWDYVLLIAVSLILITIGVTLVEVATARAAELPIPPPIKIDRKAAMKAHDAQGPVKIGSPIKSRRME